MDWTPILTNILSILFSAGISVYLAYLGMDRKLQKILEREYIGILSREQATALLKLYLDEIKRELNREIDDFCDNNLDRLISDNSAESIAIRVRNIIETRYARVRETVANKFSRFTIAHGKNFMDFITHIDRTALSETKEGIITSIVGHIREHQQNQIVDKQALKEIISAQMIQANIHGKIIFESQLNHWYGNK